jgi:hypothetical protein
MVAGSWSGAAVLAICFALSRAGELLRRDGHLTKPPNSRTEHGHLSVTRDLGPIRYGYYNFAFGGEYDDDDYEGDSGIFHLRDNREDRNLGLYHQILDYRDLQGERTARSNLEETQFRESMRSAENLDRTDSNLMTGGLESRDIIDMRDGRDRAMLVCSGS